MSGRARPQSTRPEGSIGPWIEAVYAPTDGMGHNLVIRLGEGPVVTSDMHPNPSLTLVGVSRSGTVLRLDFFDAEKGVDLTGIPCADQIRPIVESAGYRVIGPAEHYHRVLTEIWYAVHGPRMLAHQILRRLVAALAAWRPGPTDRPPSDPGSR